MSIRIHLRIQIVFSSMVWGCSLKCMTTLDYIVYNAGLPAIFFRRMRISAAARLGIAMRVQCLSASCRMCAYLSYSSPISHGMHAFAYLSRNYSTSTNGKEQLQESGLRKRLADAYSKRLQYAIEQINKANTKYENFVGLSDVQEAQSKVKEAEALFLEARAKERSILREMISTREKLKHVRERLSHVDYSNPIYLQLASEQHALVTEEDKQKSELGEAEDHERDTFSTLSNAMRESYEHERARVERTKNWSIIGTMIGTIIGMLGSIYMNRVRTKNLIKTVQESSDMSEVSTNIQLLASNAEEKQAAIVTAITNLSEHMSDMSQALQVQNMEVLSGFVNDSLRGSVPASDGLSQSSSNGHKQLAPSNATIQVLSEEIDQYNKALLSLSNAVLALSNTQTASNGSNNDKKDMVEESLGQLLNNSVTANEKLDDIISSTDRVDISRISNRLQTIEEYLLQLRNFSSTSAPVIMGIHDDDDDESSSNWRTGLKDLALWGIFLYGVYAIIMV